MKIIDFYNAEKILKVITFLKIYIKSVMKNVKLVLEKEMMNV